LHKLCDDVLRGIGADIPVNGHLTGCVGQSCSNGKIYGRLVSVVFQLEKSTVLDLTASFLLDDMPGIDSILVDYKFFDAIVDPAEHV
jgi:hypothetical protein